MHVSRSRAATLVGLAASISFLNACSTAEQKRTDDLESSIKPHLEMLQTHHLEAKRFSSALAMLNNDLAQNHRVQDQLNKVIPKLIAQSDAALAQAQQYKKQETFMAGERSKKIINDQAAAQQSLADAKASTLMAARQEIETAQQHERLLTAQIGKLTAQKQNALKLAKTESDQIHKLQMQFQQALASRSSQSRQQIAKQPGKDVSPATNEMMHKEKNVAHTKGNPNM